ncbi:MAG: dihydrofolate reductase [Rhizobiales bacterium]|nr:dihydrofolate reductase [Hyphomicrobiales bacterium]
MKIVLVAAIGENNIIGRDGQLPWRLKSDLRHFRTLTLDKPVIMGRKTFQSIGKALDRRTNIVITRDANFAAPGAVTAPSFAAALDLARQDAAARGADEIMIIGGSDVFAAALPLADRLEITHVHASPAGDVKFPPIDPKVWREVSRSENNAGPQDDAGFAVVTYIRC